MEVENTDTVELCSTCRFRGGYIGKHVDGDYIREYFECQRFPPILVNIDAAKLRTGDGFDFPVTSTNDWCGEFQTKEPK